MPTRHFGANAQLKEECSKSSMTSKNINLSSPPNGAPNNLLCLKQFSDKYSPLYFEYEGRRLHFVDTGAGQFGRTAVCLHSRYGWAYSFRKIIPTLVFHGFRVVAVDLLGFGLSEKPDDTSELSVTAQCDKVKALIEYLDLKELTLIGHEMGASVASQLPSMLPGSVEALVFANPAIRISDRAWPGLHMWQTLMNAKLDISIKTEILNICPQLEPSDLEAYNAPLLTPNGLVGARHFHQTVILNESDPDYAFIENGYRWLREEWCGRTVVLAGTKDPIFGVSTAKKFRAKIGCARPVMQLDNVCGHPFEQQPDSIKHVINELFSA